MMNDSPIVLSISMLISGKEDMSRSLESLRYFKDAFPCEIILVDTGCNAEQRALAERYADLIVDFAWCNDFAAARNAGLEKARGEWFLYLDDDEWFDDPREIISFFESGEYKKYNCASYVVRNYSNAQGTMYDDSYPSRMVKLEPETRFVGKIHEYLEPFKLPKKTFSDFVHHYGYVYKNTEEKRKHAFRNIEPLLEMRKEHPGDPRWMCQLAQEYFAIGEYEKVIQVCKESLDEWASMKEYVEYAPSHVGAVYAYLLIALESAGLFEEEEKWLGNALAVPLMKMKIMEPTVAFYCLAGARLYSYIKKYEMCRDYIRRYFKYYEALKDDRTAIEVGTAAVVDGVFQEQYLYGVILMSMESLIRMEDYKLAEKAFYMLDWTGDRRLLHQNRWEKNMLDACCSVTFHPLWPRLMQTLVSRQDGMKEMLVVFLETEIAYKQQGESEKLSGLHHIAAELDYEHRYILCMKILWAEENPETASVEERVQKAADLFGRLFEKYQDEIFEIRAEVWSVAERLGISLESLLLQIDGGRWNSLLEQWSRGAGVEELHQWDIRLSGWRRQADIRYDLFAVKCMEGYLRHYREVCPEPAQLEQMLWQYADRVLHLWETDETAEISKEAQLARSLKELRAHREQEDDRKTLESLRQCLGIYPPLEDVIDDYAKMVRDEISGRNGVSSEEQQELRRLVDTLKEAARLRMARNDYAAAKEILLQVQQCVPEDEEVRSLLGQINLFE